MAQVGNFRNKIHPTSIKTNHIFLECPHRTPRWHHVEASLFLDCPPRIPRCLHVEASKGVVENILNILMINYKIIKG
jgi:hypothetical protein